MCAGKICSNQHSLVIGVLQHFTKEKLIHSFVCKSRMVHMMLMCKHRKFHLAVSCSMPILNQCLYHNCHNHHLYDPFNHKPLVQETSRRRVAENIQNIYTGMDVILQERIINDAV